MKNNPGILLRIAVLTSAVLSLCPCRGLAEGISLSAATGPKGMELVLEKGRPRIPIVKVDGRKAWHIAAGNARPPEVYFSISDNAYKDGGHPSVVFTVDYYDKGSGVVTLQYDSLEANPQPGAAKTAGAITLGATNQWKTASFAVTDARFDDRCRNADFRLALRKDVEFLWGAIAIAPGTAPPSVAWRQTPRGTVVRGTFDQSRIYPGTTHPYWVYVPQQYEPAKPACLYISQDGLKPQFVTALNRLIDTKKIPVTVAIWVHAGSLDAPTKAGAPRANRCYEYDSLGDWYARFLLDEFLPFIATTHHLKLSQNGNDRAIGGGSSGGICALNAAWERPEAFPRVFCVSGSFVAFRGGDIFPVLIRQCEAKALRVFLHVGANDMVNSGGDWYLANQELQRALELAGYDYQYRFSDGHHMDKYTEIFPEAMTWLWRDWPKPIAAGVGPPRLQDILLPNESWKLVGQGYKSVSGLTVNPRGEVFFCDAAANRLYKIGTDGLAAPLGGNPGAVRALTTDTGGRLFGVSAATGAVLALDAGGHGQPIADGIRGQDLAAVRGGGLYVTSPGTAGTADSKVWYVSAAGEKKVVDSGLKAATGIAISVDGWQLFVADGRSHWVYVYQINADGSLSNKQRFYWLHVADDADDAGAEGLCVDRDGRLFTATRTGIQVSGLQGHPQGTIAAPGPRISAICLGGPNFDLLYAACGDKVFQRKVKVKATGAFLEPIKTRAGKL